MALLNMFGSKPPQQGDTPVVKVAVIGISTAGKTYLLNAIHRLIFGGITFGKIRLGALSAEDTTVKFNQIQENINLMQKVPLPGTAIKYDFDFRMLYQVTPVLRIVYHDSVGQILTDSDPKRNPSRNEFLKTLSQANIVWLLLPMQVDKEGRYLGISQKDIWLATGYLQDALQNRTNPLAFAILLTKADVLEDPEQEKSRKALHSLHTELKEAFEWLIGCDFVSDSVLFPISALGFGNTKFVASEENDHETGTYLLSGTDLKPYNVKKLLLWSLYCGVHYQNLSSSGPKVDDVVRREISSHLQQLDGLFYPLKGEN